MKEIDITGKRFGKLVAIRRVENTDNCWLFKCDCGNEKVMRKINVTRGKAVSCGCYRKEIFSQQHLKNIKYSGNIEGMRSGKLVAIKPVSPEQNSRWIVRCDCGNELILHPSLIENNRRTSCGCVEREKILHNARSSNIKKLKEVKSSWFHKNGSTIISTRNKSGCVGVCFTKQYNKWLAYIGFKGKLYRLGMYECKDNAIAARKEAEEKLVGPFLEWYNENYNKNRIIKDKEEI